MPAAAPGRPRGARPATAAARREGKTSAGSPSPPQRRRYGATDRTAGARRTSPWARGPPGCSRGRPLPTGRLDLAVLDDVQRLTGITLGEHHVAAVHAGEVEHRRKQRRCCLGAEACEQGDPGESVLHGDQSAAGTHYPYEPAERSDLVGAGLWAGCRFGERRDHGDARLEHRGRKRVGHEYGVRPLSEVEAIRAEQADPRHPGRQRRTGPIPDTDDVGYDLTGAYDLGREVRPRRGHSLDERGTSGVIEVADPSVVVGARVSRPPPVGTSRTTPST